MNWLSLCLYNWSFFSIRFIKSKYFNFKRLRSTNENISKLSSRLRPEDLKLFPKAVARKENIRTAEKKKSRKKIETRILTFTPESNWIEQATTIMVKNKTQVVPIKRKFSKTTNLKKQINPSKTEQKLDKFQEKCSIENCKGNESEIKVNTLIFVSYDSQLKKR